MSLVKSQKRFGIAYFVFLFLIFGFVHQRAFDTATPVSRLDLLHSLFLQKTFKIDAYQKNTTNKSIYDGHYYSDKAPGMIVAALPGFTAASVILYVAGIPLDSKQGWFISSWIACVLSNGVLGALGGVMVFAWLSKYVASKWALLTSLTLFLGAAPFPYATMMFSHTWVVGAIAIALWALDKQSEILKVGNPLRQGINQSDGGEPELFHSGRWDAIAGFALGWALASEYTAGVVIVGIFVWTSTLNWRRAMVCCLAAVPPLLLIPLYSYICFGKPFLLPYATEAFFPEMSRGIYSIQWPDAETAFRLLFSPTRGLLFWTPFIAMAVFGYQKFTAGRQLFWLTYALPLLQILVISGRVWDWTAGPTLGPRYLAPILPLLALPCALGIKRFPKIGVVLAVYSMGVTILATLTNACVFGTVYNPLLEVNIPLLRQGIFSPNIGSVSGLSSHMSIVIFFLFLIGGIVWLWRELLEVTRQDSLPAEVQN